MKSFLTSRWRTISLIREFLRDIWHRSFKLPLAWQQLLTSCQTYFLIIADHSWRRWIAAWLENIRSYHKVIACSAFHLTCLSRNKWTTKKPTSDLNSMNWMPFTQCNSYLCTHQNRMHLIVSVRQDKKTGTQTMHKHMIMILLLMIIISRVIFFTRSHHGMIWLSWWLKRRRWPILCWRKLALDRAMTILRAMDCVGSSWVVSWA